MFRKVKKLLKNSNEKKKDKKSRSQTPTDDELFIDPKRFVLTERYKILWEYLMKHAPNADGIFRVPGSQPRIRALKLLLDSQNTPDLEQYDVHVVAGVFKQYLREQKEPLLTHDLYEGFIAAHGIEDEKKKIDTAKSLLNNLPLGFLTALRALVELLYKIDRNSAVNLMSMTNLAIVFSPTLLRARDETVAKIMQDATAAHGIVLFLLSQPELLTFFGIKATEKNDLAMAGEPKSDPTLISEPRTIATAGNRESRLLAQSSPNMVAPSSSPVLLQVGEHAMTPRGRLINRERTSSSSSNSPTRSPRHSKIKLSSDYLSKDTMNIIAALDMIIEGKDISSSDDDTVKSSDSNPSSPMPSMTSPVNNNNTSNNNTSSKPVTVTSDEFDISAAISQPLKPKGGEKIEHLDSESEDSEIDSEEELLRTKPKKHTPPPQPVPVPVAVDTEPAPRKGNTKIGSNRAPQPKKELFEQPLKSSQSMPRMSPRKNSNGNMQRSPRKDSASNGTDETKKNSPRKDSTANGVVDPKKNSPRNETAEPKKESPREDQQVAPEPKKESPRKEEPVVQSVEVKKEPVEEHVPEPVAVKQEEPVVVPPEPVKVKEPTPPISPRVETPRKLPTPPTPLSPRDNKPLSPHEETMPTPLSPRDNKPLSPRKEDVVVQPTPLSPRETKLQTPRKEEVAVEEPKSASPPKVASPVQSPRKVEDEVQQQPEVKQQHTEQQVAAPPKTPTPTAVAPKKTAVSPKTVTPKAIVPKLAPPKQQTPKQQSPKQVSVSPKVVVPLQRTQTAPEMTSPRTKVIMPDPQPVNEEPNPDYKISEGVTPIALPNTPVAHVKVAPVSLVASPKTPAGQGKVPLNSPKGPQSPHTPTSGRSLASPKKATAVIVSPRGPSSELVRTSSVSVITKPTTNTLSPDLGQKHVSPRSMTTEDVGQKEKQKNDKLKRQHMNEELLNDLDLIEQFTCRMYQDMEVYNKEQTGFVVEIFKDITKFLTSSLKEEKVMITPADINKFTNGSNARFITDIDSGKIAIRDQFKVIMGLSGEIKERIFAPASAITDAYLENLSFMFDQITEFLENVIAEMSEDDDEEEAAPGIDPQLLQLKNALEEAIQKLEKDIVTKFTERITKAASFYSVPHLTILFDSLVWMKKKLNGFNPPMPEDQIIQQVLRISQPSVVGNLAPDAMTKAHSLIASCAAELKDLIEFQLQKMKAEATNALNNFDGSIARYRIINSVKVLNQIAQFVAKFKQVPAQMSDNVVPTATKDESDQLAKETMQQIDRLKLIGTVIKKQLLNVNGLEQAILVSKIIKTIKLFVMSASEVEVNGQDLIDFATSYDKLSDELKSIVARGLPVTEASPEDVPKVKSLLVAGSVIMDEFIASLPKLKENVTELKAKAFPHTHIEYASQRVKLIYKLLELIVQVNKSYDGPLSATPRALSMPTVLSPPGSPSLLPTSPRAMPQPVPVSPRTATGAGTAASNPGLIRSHSSPMHDSGVIDEKTTHCRQLISVVLSQVNSINDINHIVAMGQVGKAVKKVLNDAAKKQPVAFVNLTLNLEPSAEPLSPEHLEKMNSLKHLIINLFKDVDKELSHISSFGINNTMALSVLNYIQQLLSKLN